VCKTYFLSLVTFVIQKLALALACGSVILAFNKS